jgi:xylulokinase
MLLGLDIGTTHLKAGLFDEDGALRACLVRPNQRRRSPEGWEFYDPDELWQTLLVLLGDLARQAQTLHLEPARAVGIASMAETGLLLDRRGGTPRAPLLPWFDPAATPQAEALKQRPDLEARFYVCGLRPSFKCAVAKLLWLQQRGIALDGAIWLGAADYLLYRLAGVFATDGSLASRTCAYRLEQQRWDAAWLESLGLPGEIFPPLLPGGAPAGACRALPGLERLIPAGTPVGVAGHDHVCAAFAVALASGGVRPGLIFDSIGTAEPLTGAFPARPLGPADYRSGLAFGQHAAPGFLYWMGGLSASGGSLEWLRGILGDPPLSYAALEALLDDLPEGPSGLLYFPYLAGSGSPHSDPHVRGALLGLSAAAGRGSLVKAVLEGVAFEMEFIRRAARSAMSAQAQIGAPSATDTPSDGSAVERIVAAGGGVRNRRWLQIKADVHGCPLEVFPESEATLLGAALLAGRGLGLSPVLALGGAALERFEPDPARHAAYCEVYERGYLPLQQALRSLGRGL